MLPSPSGEAVALTYQRRFCPAAPAACEVLHGSRQADMAIAITPVVRIILHASRFSFRGVPERSMFTPSKGPLDSALADSSEGWSNRRVLCGNRLRTCEFF